MILYRIFRSALGWLEASDLLLLKLREAAYVHRLTDSKQVSQLDISFTRWQKKFVTGVLEYGRSILIG